jgi:hypothetical protein
MSTGAAVPGTVVPSGAEVAPGGAQGQGGQSGQPAYSLTTASLTIPAIGQTANVTVQNSSWANVGEFVSVQGAGGSGQSAVLQITAISGTTLTLLNPTQGGLSLSGNSTDYVGGDGTSHNLVTAIQPTIWSARLRSFNAVGNPTFEIDQRNVGTALTNPANGALIQDRWAINKSGATLTGTVNTALQDSSTAPILLPGTNFGITAKFQRFTVGTAQASLAAGDYYAFFHSVEGPSWRELSSDVHSLSLLVRSSVAGLVFSVALQDNGRLHSLAIQCTISAANTWTLIQLPNLPVWSGAFSAAPGQLAYYLFITLAAGTTYTAAASSAWQNTNILGVTGNSNFLATAGATFDIAFVQHEPGSLCTTLIDKPFAQNLDECLRYYEKSYGYSTAPGTVTTSDVVNMTQFSGAAAAQSVLNPLRFKKVMAKPPTISIYSGSTGAINKARNGSTNADVAVSAINTYNEAGFSGFQLSAAPTLPCYIQYHYTADTGW